MLVEFGIPAELDMVRWRRAFEEGKIPDAVPYGLDKLSAAGVHFQTTPLAPLTRKRGISLALGGRSNATTPGWAIAWDEHVGLRLLAQSTGERTGCGVIWATDELGRGPAANAKARMRLSMLRSLDLVWCLSRAQVIPLRRAVGHRTRVEFLKFGVDTRFFAAEPLPSRPAVLSVGNDKDRDTPTLLAALEIVHRIRPEVALRVQFAGDYEVPSGIERLALMSHVELRNEYARATVVAIATRSNLHVSGMTAVLEGMSVGRPVVLTRTPGAEDYVEHGTWGFLVEPGNPQDLARRILETLDEDNTARLGSAARAAAVREYDTSHMAQRLALLLGVGLLAG